MSLQRALGGILWLAASLTAAQAADYAGTYASPAPVSDSIWLGHFSGGRNLAPGVEPIPLDWVDVKERFASLRDCEVWQRDYKRAYGTYEGFKTCLRIR